MLQISYQGKTRTLREWAEELGLTPQILHGRVFVQRMPLDRAMVSAKFQRAEQVNAERASCAHGHPFTDMNTYLTKDGRRQCRKCRSLRTIAWRKRAQ